VEPLLTTNY